MVWLSVPISTLAFYSGTFLVMIFPVFGNNDKHLLLGCRFPLKDSPKLKSWDRDQKNDPDESDKEYEKAKQEKLKTPV
jgi:hypothetical protein